MGIVLEAEQHLEHAEELRELLADGMAKAYDLFESADDCDALLVAGDRVWERRDKQGKSHSKFLPTWTGPFRVEEVVTPVSYMIRNLYYPESQPRKVHLRDLRRHIPSSDSHRTPAGSLARAETQLPDSGDASCGFQWGLDKAVDLSIYAEDGSDESEIED